MFYCYIFWQVWTGLVDWNLILFVFGLKVVGIIVGITCSFYFIFHIFFVSYNLKMIRYKSCIHLGRSSLVHTHKQLIPSILFLAFITKSFLHHLETLFIYVLCICFDSCVIFIYPFFPILPTLSKLVSSWLISATCQLLVPGYQDYVIQCPLSKNMSNYFFLVLFLFFGCFIFW